jgi:hypothetical protein
VDGTSRHLAGRAGLAVKTDLLQGLTERHIVRGRDVKVA